MHKPPLMIFRSEDNARHLQEVGQGLREAGVNILAIGGGEFEGVGVFAFTYDDDDNPATVEAVESLLDRLEIQRLDFDGVTVQLSNDPGSLGDMAEVLKDAEINITSLLVLSSDSTSAIVLVGVPDGLGPAAGEALEAKNYVVFHDHDEGPVQG